jgi:hypothetical protein
VRAVRGSRPAQRRVRPVPRSRRAAGATFSRPAIPVARGPAEPSAEQRFVDVIQAPESQRRHQPRRRLGLPDLSGISCPWNSPKVTHEL